MKKVLTQLVLFPTVLVSSAMAISGCGENDNGVYVYGTAGDNSELVISQFDKGIDRQTNREAIARIDTGYSDGEREITITNIIGNFNSQNINNLDNSIVLADRFEGTLEDRYIEVDGRTVKRPVYQKNSNNRFDYQTVYRTLDLSNVRVFDYQQANGFNSARGIFTALNNYPSIANNAFSNLAFPNGAVCYIPVTTSERSFYAFNDRDRSSFQNLDRWIDAAEGRFSDNRNSRTTRFSVGENNNNRAAQVKFFAFGNDPEYLYNGIEYNNDIYETDYIDSNQLRPNENTINGVVDCSLVNDIAADFIEAQVREYY